MYKFLTEYDTTVDKHAGKYDLGSTALQQFGVLQDILIKPVSMPKYVKDLPRNNYIVYLYGDHKADYDDKAHESLIGK